jgi:signal transduction histidine kinase
MWRRPRAASSSARPERVRYVAIKSRKGSDRPSKPSNTKPASSRKSRTAASITGEAQRLAEDLFDARSTLRGAGRALHDQVGPLLSAAGIRLALLRSDRPEAASEIEPALRALEEAMEAVRGLSRSLSPPPSANLGLKKALWSLVEEQRESFAGSIRFAYTASTVPSDEAIVAVYETASAVLALAASDRTATRLAVSVRGARKLTVAIASNGKARWSRAELAALSRRARPAGIVLASTKRGTIVSIRYASRRSARR